MNLHRCIHLLSILAACLALAGAPARAAQQADIPRIIFDSDMSSDHDDAADIAVLHGLADLGECEIIACMASSQNGATAVAFNAINAYYGRPDIPCGRRPDCGGPGEYPGILIAEFPHPKYATWQDPPLCADLYRQVLAAQPDRSVSIVTTGYLNNLEALMKSGPDRHSALNGMDLIRQKVKLLSCAGGCYPNGNEFNLRVEPAAAHYVITNWPTSAFFDGYDVGQSIYSGAGLEQTGRENPIRRAFELTFFGPYPTWGQLMIYYAVRTAESRILWNYNTTGRNNCDATGYNWWSTDSDPSGAQEQGYMLEIERFPVQQAIETLVMNSGAPKSRGTVKPPNQPTNLRGTVVGGNRIDLQWTDNAWNETGFAIERKVNGAFVRIATVAADATAYSDTGLASTGDANYRVKAVNALGGSAYATVAVYSGWTEANLTDPSDRTPIYHRYQNNLNWIRGPRVCNHVAVNDDSSHGQDLTVDVMVGAQGGYGKYFVYFFYQDQNNWYRLSAGSQNQGQANNISRFEKCINGTITQIGAAATGVNLGDGCLMQTWQVTVSRNGTLTYANNNNPTGNAFPAMHQVLSVSDALSFSGGRIALGTDIGQPVWGNFSFDTATTGTPVAVPATGLSLAPATAVVAPNAAVTLTATVSPADASSPTFAWYSSASAGTTGGTRINGQTGATYAPPTATVGTTYYYATVTAGGATVASAGPATVTVRAAPVITTQPVSQAVSAGSTVSFTVAASGAGPLGYQWKLGTANVGANSATLTIANVQAMHAGSYTCIVSNAAGSSVSQAAVLSIATGNLDPLIPATVIISDGGGGWNGSAGTADKAFDGNPATGYDAANGDSAYTGIDVGAASTATVTAIRFQARAGWPQRMIGGVFEGSNSPAAGYVTLVTVGSASDTAWTTLTVGGAAPYRYLRYRTPAGGWCNVAEIEFHGTRSVAGPVAPAITTQPVGVTVSAGQTAIFTVAASGTAPLSYQWRRGAANVGTNSATLAIANAQPADAGSYICTVGNGAGSVASQAATLAISTGGLAPLIPRSAIISDGGGGWNGSGSIADKAFDGDAATAYDAANGDSAYTGIDVGAGNAATATAIRFQARAGWPQRMVGGVFEGSNSPASGYVALAIVGSASDTAWTTLTVSGAAPYRYLRYRTPVGGWCNVAEIEFRGTTANPVVPMVAAVGPPAAEDAAAGDGGGSDCGVGGNLALLIAGALCLSAGLRARG